MPTIPSVIFFRESFPEIYRKRPRGPTTCSVLQRNKPRTQFAKRTRWGPPWALPQRSGMKWASRSDAAFRPSQALGKPGTQFSVAFGALVQGWYRDNCRLSRYISKMERRFGRIQHPRLQLLERLGCWIRPKSISQR